MSNIDSRTSDADRRMSRLVTERRKALGLSQADVAARCGVEMHQSMVSGLERGQKRWALWHITRMARALEMDFVFPLAEPGEGSDRAAAEVSGPPAGSEGRTTAAGVEGVTLSMTEWMILKSLRNDGPRALLLHAYGLLEARPDWES